MSNDRSRPVASGTAKDLLSGSPASVRHTPAKRRLLAVLVSPPRWWEYGLAVGALVLVVVR